MKFLGPIVEKSESFIIGEIFRTSKNSLIYIAKDDREINDIYSKLLWLLPNKKILIYKAWDQIPYDNISPLDSSISLKILLITIADIIPHIR